MNPLIAIDIGNTNTAYALYDDLLTNKITKLGHLATKHLSNSSKDVFFALIKALEIKPHVVVSSVVPALTNSLKELLAEIAKMVLIVNPVDVDTIVQIGNQKTGADRICTMAGAYSIYKTDLAVVDFGTATTVSVVDKDARFIAGAILPGVELMLRCLHQNTAQLPDVKITTCKKTTTIDTESSILNGVVIGTAGAVERIIKDVEKENGFVLQLILTGGMVDFVKDKITLNYTVNKTLIFEGMRNILLRNLI
ncbi:MAG: type III pantothenate kinase [Thermodesulfovibrionales bacterium]|nr:type III pantothenate kinase [Thermodesulfovibrionales bacterium]